MGGEVSNRVDHEAVAAALLDERLNTDYLGWDEAVRLARLIERLVMVITHRSPSDTAELIVSMLDAIAEENTAS